MNYLEFIRSKIEQAPVSGFDIDTGELHHVLLPHQRDIVKWLVKGGRRALFASFGLGKTIMELEYCRIITQHEHGKALLIMPLGVKQEFVHDAVQLLDMNRPTYVTCMQDIRVCDNDIMITNYERVRDGDIDPSYFVAVSLDEASVLRSFGSKVYQTFIDKFKGVKYKIVATATPSPNRYKELIHYAGFLEIMDTGQALTRFFKRDSTKANNLTLLPAQEDEFWMWMSSWAIFVTKPSDIDPQYRCRLRPAGNGYPVA
ncbi:MAG: SNF2-related protein [[Clostridium] innocuum]